MKLLKATFNRHKIHIHKFQCVECIQAPSNGAPLRPTTAGLIETAATEYDESAAGIAVSRSIEDRYVKTPSPGRAATRAGRMQRRRHPNAAEHRAPSGEMATCARRATAAGRRRRGAEVRHLSRRAGNAARGGSAAAPQPLTVTGSPVLPLAGGCAVVRRQ
ncbi:hypothetical protein EVAR_21202_1 [Eumeta japonica]|uniref:Uncharacterized protein n=1 Tax=Eumeta variegata TaxID=151549 RepID=A0A4C1UQ27_EUMVA|nr:hypothetical protein EVAR_21202_1 [Eumeta japonica]